jgi:hypothetical protein
MKVYYDKFGIKVIGVTFILSVIISIWIKKSYSFFIIPFTIGVFLPYILVLICTFLYYLIKDQELYILSDWRVAIILLLFEYFVIYGHLSSN